MDKYDIVQRIENFAPIDTQESWDCSGWIVETAKRDINKIMLCLTVTQDIINQAKDFDMIISHHPLFSVPIIWKNKDIYCAHTNFDLAKGGTTDFLINKLFESEKWKAESGKISEIKELNFLRYIDTNVSISDFINILRKISPNLRYVNNKNIKMLKRIAFCAGSGSEFINDAYINGADALVTGDIKFHTALESPIVLFDIGHFESEIISLKVFEKLIGQGVEIAYAQEQSPFKYL